MEELSKYIAAHADLPKDKADLAAAAAIEFIKKRVADTVDDQVLTATKNLGWLIKAEVHEALTGEPDATLSERFGDFTEDAKEKFGDLAEGAKEKMGALSKNAKNFFGSFMKKDKPEGKTPDVTEEKP
jgi:uncharacterized protein YabN with tetrapyrrole methylase and pyrophosphatase domain